MSSNEEDLTKSDSDELENTANAIKRRKLDFLDECANTPSDYKCMVTFKVGKDHQELVQVPCCLLALKSPVFKQMFFGSLKETSEVQIPDAEPDTYKSFVRYLITPSEEVITDENVYKMIYLAKKYIINDLVVMCECHLANSLSLTNVASVLNNNVWIDSNYLLKRTMEFIIKNQMKLFPSDCFNDCTRDSITFLLKSSHLVVAEDKILKMLQTWVIEELKRKNIPQNCIEQKEILKPLMKYIRLHCLSKKTCTDLLDDENCPDEAKNDLELIVQQQSLYIAKYFCNSARLSLGQALQYDVIFFETTKKLSLWMNKCENLMIKGVFIKAPTDRYYSKRGPHTIDLENDFFYKNSQKKVQLEVPDSGIENWVAFVPQNGFLVQGKANIEVKYYNGYIAEEKDNLDWKIIYNVLLKESFNWPIPNNINIERKDSDKDRGIFGLLYQIKNN